MKKSAKPQPREQKSAPVQSFVHEVNSHTGDHRIVIFNGNSVRRGEWARNNAIATLDDYRATTDQYAGVLPTGIFACKPINTVTL